MARNYFDLWNSVILQNVWWKSDLYKNVNPTLERILSHFLCTKFPCEQKFWWWKQTKGKQPRIGNPHSYQVESLIACPSAWSIRVSFFYVPKNYPKRIREKKQSPWTIQILSQNFFLNLAMFKIFSMSQELSEEKKQTPWTIQIVSVKVWLCQCQ